MHSSYNYCGFVDLYKSLSRQRPVRSGTATAAPTSARATPLADNTPARPNGPAERRVRLVSG